MADSLYYVYAVVPPGTAVAVAPAGVDDARVELIASGDVAALVSRVDGSVYGANVDDLVADVAWLGPRATAHDAVLTWASDVGAVIPLPLLSLFRSSDAVRDMLAARRDELARLLEHVARGREYGVRIFRLDEELRSVLGEHSSSIAALEGEVAAAASPGQGYLLARKLDAARKDELRRVAAMIANTAYVDLAARSLEATQDALPKATAEQSGAAVLNASFLVAHDRIDDFRAAVTAFVRDHAHRGFRVEFTGPWPPYHFTRSVADVR
jgi:hypothetical protein